MKAVVLFTVLNIIVLTSTAPAPVGKNDNCINMTPHRKKQFEYVEKKISELLLNLEEEIGDIAISDVTLNINKYTDEEAKKDIVLNVSVNECGNSSKYVEDKVTYYEECKDTDVEQSNDNEDFSSKEDDNVDDQRDENKEDIIINNRPENKEASTAEVAIELPVSSFPEVKFIRLNDEEERRVQEMEKTTGFKPFLLIEKGNGERKIRFL